MSQLEVDKIIPQSGTTLTIGDSGDTITFADGAVIGIDTDTLYIDSTNNRVGIGTSSPSVKLDVAGNLKAGNTIDFGLADANNTIMNVGIGATGDKFAITDYIGDTTYTDYGLRVGRKNDGANGTSTLEHRGTGQLVLNAIDAGNIQFLTSSTERMRIDSSGNVGIGTSSPSFALSVSSTSANTITAINNASNISRFCFAENSTPSSTYTNIEGDARSSGYIAFRTNDTQKVKIDQNGSIPIFSTQSNISARNSNGAGTSEAFFTGLYSAPNNSGGGTVSLRLWTNGNIQNTNNSYTALSDIKLKENIVDANSQWEDIKALKVRNYNFKEGQTHTQIGLIAQELELTSPNLVFDVVDKDDDGNDLGTVTKSVNYSVLYMKAVKALQEALTEIDNLKARVDTLEGN